MEYMAIINSQLASLIENNQEIYIKFSDTYKKFDLYAQETFILAYEDLIEEDVLSEYKGQLHRFVKLVSKQNVLKIDEAQYNSIMNMKRLSIRKFNTDRLEFETNLSLNQFLTHLALAIGD